MFQNVVFTSILLVITALVAAPISAEEVNGAGPSNLYLSHLSKPKFGDHPNAIANIEGKKVPLALDTCATLGLSLFTPTCQALGLEVRENDGGLQYTHVRVGVDAAGTMSQPHFALVADAPQKLPFAGVLGWEGLRKKVWDLDYPKKRQDLLHTLPEELVEDWISFPIIDVPMKVLAINVPTENGDLLVYIDTGSFEGVSLPKSSWERWRAEDKPDWVTLQAAYSPSNKTGFEVSRTAVTDRYLLGELDLGRVRVSDMQAPLAFSGEEVHIPVLLGFDALRQRRIIIDGPGGRVYFAPLSERAEDLEVPEINRAQATFVPPSMESEDMFAHVIEGGIAHRAGLRDGDKILMVDGGLARNWKSDDSVRPSTVFNQSPGKSVRLMIERDGERSVITIELGRSPLDPPETPDE